MLERIVLFHTPFTSSRVVAFIFTYPAAAAAVVLVVVVVAIV